MIQSISGILLWLFVINLGIAFGAGLYESRIVVPDWIDATSKAGYFWNAEAARRDNTGLRFWVYVTTIPLTLLTVLSLIFARQAEGAARFWWLLAAFASFADRILTFAYFIPTMVKLINDGSLPQSKSAAIAVQWVNLGYVRHALVLIAFLAALKAFSVFGRQFG